MGAGILYVWRKDQREVCCPGLLMLGALPWLLTTLCERREGTGEELSGPEGPEEPVPRSGGACSTNSESQNFLLKPAPAKREESTHEGSRGFKGRKSTDARTAQGEEIKRLQERGRDWLARKQGSRAVSQKRDSQGRTGNSF